MICVCRNRNFANEKRPGPIQYHRQNCSIQETWNSSQNCNGAYHPAITVIVLGLLAIPLSHSEPREGRGIRIVLGILIYLLYGNLLYLSRSWVAGGQLPAYIGMWSVHIVFLVICFVWVRRQGTVSGEGEVKMIRTVDRYIGTAAIFGILLVWVSLTALMMMFSLLGELRDTTSNYVASDVLWFVLQTGPRSAYQIFPVSALMGSLLGIGSLASANELVAFRTSGVSRLRLATAALAGALLLTIPVMVIGEWVAPDAEQQARAFRLSKLSGQVIIGGPSGMWMRDGSDIVNIRRPLLSADRGQQSISFQDIEIHHFDGFLRVAENYPCRPCILSTGSSGRLKVFPKLR